MPFANGSAFAFDPRASAGKEAQIVRPQIITPELIKKICDYIAAGHSYAKAAKLAGIAESTFFRWRMMGQLEGAEPIYVAFYCEIEEASAFSESEALQLVRSSAIRDGNWRAAAWFLERRFPHRYGKQTLVAPTENDDGEDGLGILVSA
jgi:transposase